MGSAQVHRGPISSVVSLQNAQQPVLLTAGKLDCRLKLHEVGLALVFHLNTPFPRLD